MGEGPAPKRVLQHRELWSLTVGVSHLVGTIPPVFRFAAGNPPACFLNGSTPNNSRTESGNAGGSRCASGSPTRRCLR